jgi:hypothetical protein
VPVYSRGCKEGGNGFIYVSKHASKKYLLIESRGTPPATRQNTPSLKQFGNETCIFATSYMKRKNVFILIASNELV